MYVYVYVMYVMNVWGCRPCFKSCYPHILFFFFFLPKRELPQTCPQIPQIPQPHSHSHSHTHTHSIPLLILHQQHRAQPPVRGEAPLLLTTTINPTTIEIQRMPMQIQIQISMSTQTMTKMAPK
jgi:hypothetical protein